ncbi:MAG: hypothetical protein ACYCWW_18340 [Deltaproteobacteria bacterium]
MAFDLLLTSSLLRSHAAAGKVVLGVNHEMTDFATQRKKDLDLVIARPAGPPPLKTGSFAELADRYGILLDTDEQALLAELPDLPIAPVAAALVALEAKACMTAHVKSLPRLYDELNSSHLCVHGASRQALAIGFVQVNNSKEFISSVSNNRPLAEGGIVWNEHHQPEDTLRVLAKIAEMPRRSNSSEVGFDGLGVVVLDARNDGSPVTIVSGPPTPALGDSFNYASMIVRMATVYDATFGNI